MLQAVHVQHEGITYSTQQTAEWAVHREGFMQIILDDFATPALAVVILVAGSLIKQRVKLLRTFCIPTPVVGGIIFTLLVLVGHVTGYFSFKLNTKFSDFFMLAFYTSIGFSAYLPLLKQAGKAGIKFLLLSSALVVLQNGLGVAGSFAMGIDPLVGLATGSIPMTGGHGTSSVFAPVLIKLGLPGADTIALASATFGLVAGALVGGPMGVYLIKKVGNQNTQEQGIDFNLLKENKLTEQGFEKGIFMLVFAMSLGVYLGKLLSLTGLEFPASVGGMLASALLVNINGMKKHIKTAEINTYGNACLMIFLALSMMNLKLWEISDLAVPMLILLLMQVVLMLLFAVVDFYILGKDYEAAITTAGHCGFGLGAIPTAMANMQTLCARYSPAPRSFFIVPLVGSLFINIVNTFVITVFINIFT